MNTEFRSVPLKRVLARIKAAPEDSPILVYDSPTLSENGDKLYIALFANIVNGKKPETTFLGSFHSNNCIVRVEQKLTQLRNI